MKSIKGLIKFLVFLIVVTMIVFIIYTMTDFSTSEPTSSFDGNLSKETKPKNDIPEPEEHIDELSMVFTGDIMCHNTQFKDAYSNGTYDFKYVFDDIKDYISTPTLAIGNLETTFAGGTKEYTGYPMFNSPPELATNLKDIGFDILTTCNNHSMDTGYKGVENTLNVLDGLGIKHTGTSRSEAEQNTILYHTEGDLKIAFLAYTYGTNGIAIPSDKSYAINLINKDFILKQINQAKSEGANAIIACMHWGVEYNTSHTPEQLDLSNFLFENGVDIIVGNHPHVSEPWESRQITTADGKQKNVFLVYSLGNLMSGQTQTNTQTSALLNIEISKSNKNEYIDIKNVSYIPIFTYSNPKFKNYKILDINKTIAEYESGNKKVTPETYTLLKKEVTRLSTMYPPIHTSEHQ